MDSPYIAASGSAWPRPGRPLDLSLRFLRLGLLEETGLKYSQFEKNLIWFESGSRFWLA